MCVGVASRIGRRRGDSEIECPLRLRLRLAKVVGVDGHDRLGCVADVGGDLCTETPAASMFDTAK